MEVKMLPKSQAANTFVESIDFVAGDKVTKPRDSKKAKYLKKIEGIRDGIAGSLANSRAIRSSKPKDGCNAKALFTRVREKGQEDSDADHRLGTKEKLLT